MFRLVPSEPRGALRSDCRRCAGRRMDCPYAERIEDIKQQLASLQEEPLDYKVNPIAIPAGVSERVAEAILMGPNSA